MPGFSGTVEVVSVKEMDKQDQYENTHRASFKMGDDWFSYGSIKRGVQGEIWTKTGMITKGAEIEGMYDQNGDFKNVKKATVTVLKEGSGNTAPTRGSSTSKKGTDSYVIGMAIGASMNQAVTLHGPAKKGEVDFDFLEKTCLQLYNITQPLIADLASGKDAEKAVVEKSAPDDSFDDDIPF